jgi:flagellar basal-body rod protein FlgF
MNYGLYAAYLGMRARQRQLEVIANNLANASTTGFKADHLHFRSIEAAELGTSHAVSQINISAASNDAPAANQSALDADPARAGLENRGLGVVTGGLTDYSPGVIQQTGRPLDVALGGEGFLVVQTPRGERYTRAGALAVDNTGQLVTQQGDLVVGQGGPITLPRGEVAIGEDGTISVEGRAAGRLKIVRFTDPRAMLLKEGHSLFAAREGAQPLEATQTRVMQGTLEISNVNSVSELAAMMQTAREFDSLQRSITLQMNDLGRKVANEIGRI